VHLYGNLCDMDALLAIGERHGIPVIEDAAEAIGSIYYGERAGSMGLFGAFSFHGTKTITTGEGGMFVTNDPDLYEQVLTLSNHGRARGQSKQFWPDMVGFKYKMSNIQAAIGCAQLARIAEIMDMKHKTFKQYKDKFYSLDIQMNPEPQFCTNGHWMPTMIMGNSYDPNLMGILKNEFSSNGIDARQFFWPLSSVGVAGRKAFDCHYLSSDFANRGINLPSPTPMLQHQLSRVTAAVKSVLA